MGKIGKPQKSKKHKKLKKTFDTVNDSDFIIGSSREKLSNLPVEDADLDRQDIPRKAREMKLNLQTLTKKKMKNKKNKKTKMKKAVEHHRMERGMTKPLTPVPRFVQGKYETDKDFMRRVDIETHRVVMTAKMEDKYKIDLMGKQQGDKKSLKKGPSERKKEKCKEKKKKKVLAKQEKKLDRLMDFSSLRDDVAFGEVAMAPPSLTAKPRKAVLEDSKPRPGKKSLLLKSMIEGTTSSESAASDRQAAAAVKSMTQRQVGQTVKRKNMPPAQRQIVDFQRQRAIDLYRQMRDKKYEQNSLKT